LAEDGQVKPLRVTMWAAVAVAVGLTAEWTSERFGHPERWVPDLVTGWVVVACGLVAWSRRPDRRVGLLLTATGLLWFVGNFASVQVEALAWLAAHGVFLHRGPLVHVIVAYPLGVARSRLERVTVAAGYAAAIVTPSWGDERSAIVLGAALIVVAAVLHARSVARLRRPRLLALWVAAAVGSVIVIGAAARLILFPSDVAEDTSLLAYELVLSAAAVALAAGVMSRSMERADVTDLVVELGEDRSDRLRDVLARALGDPTLQVGYWSPATNGYIDSAGRPLPLPATGDGRAATAIGTDSDPIGILVHHPSLLDDPGLTDSIATAARLASVNAGLQAEVRAQLVALEASRRRIVTAGDEQHRRLECRLRDGAEHRLEALARRLQPAAGGTADRSYTAPLQPVAAQLAETLDDLRTLAAGLHPRLVTECGLAAALDALAARSRTATRVTVDGGRLPATVEGAAYFVCSEALANVDKHAAATWATVVVTIADRTVRIIVSDDGVGGADPAHGTGLRNLADRVHALGGTFDLTSPGGGGTCLVVVLPVGEVAG
jgi:signal transduction histidine kinase